MKKLSVRNALSVFALLLLATPASGQWWAGRGQPDIEHAVYVAPDGGGQTCWLKGGVYTALETEAEGLRKINKRKNPVGEKWSLWLSTLGWLQHANQTGRGNVQVDPSECPWESAPASEPVGSGGGDEVAEILGSGGNTVDVVRALLGLVCGFRERSESESSGESEAAGSCEPVIDPRELVTACAHLGAAMQSMVGKPPIHVGVIEAAEILCGVEVSR